MQQATEIDAQSREFYDFYQTAFSVAGSGLGTSLGMLAIPRRKKNRYIWSV